MASREGIVCRWNLSSLTPAEFERTTDALIKDVNEAYDRVAEIPLEQVGLENVIKARKDRSSGLTLRLYTSLFDLFSPLQELIEIERDHSTREAPLHLAQHCATTKVSNAPCLGSSYYLYKYTTGLLFRKCAMPLWPLPSD